MRWDDEGIILHTRPHGEQQIIVTLLTKEHGRHKGICRVSKGRRTLCESGTSVRAHWQARLEEHLGAWTLESLNTPLGFILSDALALQSLNAACALVEVCTAEREPAPKVFEALSSFIASFDGTRAWLQAYCLFEIVLVEHAGIRLDLKHCAVTGTQKDLIYVSPRSGRAASKDVGAPYKEKLLPLPDFLRPGNVRKMPKVEEIIEALDLTGYFLTRYFFISHDQEMPSARQRFIDALKRSVQP